MPSDTFTKLKALRDALNQRIEDHTPLTRKSAIKKLRAYIVEYAMTEDDLFPVPIDLDDSNDPYGPGRWKPEPEADHTDFSELVYEDTFGYTVLEDLKQQRNEVDSELYAIRREAITRALAFIYEYDLEKDDVYPLPRREN
jgi:hypothetical protein